MIHVTSHASLPTFVIRKGYVDGGTGYSMTQPPGRTRDTRSEQSLISRPTEFLSGRWWEAGGRTLGDVVFEGRGEGARRVALRVRPAALQPLARVEYVGRQARRRRVRREEVRHPGRQRHLAERDGGVRAAEGERGRADVVQHVAAITHELLPQCRQLEQRLLHGTAGCDAGGP